MGVRSEPEPYNRVNSITASIQLKCWLEARLARRPALTARLEALLADAPAAARADSAVADALLATAGLSAEDPQRFDRLMGALAAVHAWADGHDRAFAARCLDYLVDWADSEQLEIPATN